MKKRYSEEDVASKKRKLEVGDAEAAGMARCSSALLPWPASQPAHTGYIVAATLLPSVWLRCCCPCASLRWHLRVADAYTLWFSYCRISLSKIWFVMGLQCRLLLSCSLLHPIPSPPPLISPFLKHLSVLEMDAQVTLLCLYFFSYCGRFRSFIVCVGRYNGLSEESGLSVLVGAIGRMGLRARCTSWGRRELHAWFTKYISWFGNEVLVRESLTVEDPQHEAAGLKVPPPWGQLALVPHRDTSGRSLLASSRTRNSLFKHIPRSRWWKCLHTVKLCSVDRWQVAASVARYLCRTFRWRWGLAQSMSSVTALFVPFFGVRTQDTKLCSRGTTLLPANLSPQWCSCRFAGSHV